MARHSSTVAAIAGLLMITPPFVSGANLDRPNIILIVADNLGYGDIGCYGSRLNRTPRIDQMAAEGMRFTDYYIAPVCTLTRASIMTGCYAPRVGMNDYPGAVLRPASPEGLHPDEITVAEVLKKRGYATAIVGKWHLGDQPEFLPTRQGFDYWLGIPYSDNMDASKSNFPPLPLMENERVIEAPPDRNLLTKRYTEKVIELITEYKDAPFFIYMPQAMPGSTNHSFASKAFRGKSANGLYGDMIEELDWSTGRILDTLKKLNLHRSTLVIWTSDNGAWRPLKGGSNAPLSGWLGSTMEGSMRVPCVMWWPDTVPAGKECRELITAMDFLPTFGRLADAEIPDDRIIDGHDIRPLMFGQAGAKSPYEAFYYYYKAQLHAVRSGKWKLHVPLKNKIGIGVPRSCPVMLHDLEDDIGETRNLADQHPEVVKRLMELAEKAREDLGDLGRPGKNQRPIGRVSNPTPRLIGGETN